MGLSLSRYFSLSPRFALKPISSVRKRKVPPGAKESDSHSTPRLSATAQPAPGGGARGAPLLPRARAGRAVRAAPGERRPPPAAGGARRGPAPGAPEGCSSPPPRQLYPFSEGGPHARPGRASGGRRPRSDSHPEGGWIPAALPARPQPCPHPARGPPPGSAAPRPPPARPASLRPRRARTHRARGAGRRGARGARPQGPGAGCRLSPAAARRCPDPRAPPAAGVGPGAGRRRGASARRPPPPRCAPPAGCGGRRGGLHQPRLYSGPGLRGGVGNAEPAGLPAPHVREGGRGSGAAGRGAARRGGTSRRHRHPRHPRPRRAAAPQPALCLGPARAALRGAGRPAPHPG